VQAPSSPRETVRDLLVQALTALARDGIIRRRPRTFRSSARSGPSTATSPPTSRWRSRRAPARRPGRSPRRSSRGCRSAGRAARGGDHRRPGLHQPAPRSVFWQRLLPAILDAGDDWGRGAARPRPRSSSSTCPPTRPVPSRSRTAATARSATRDAPPALRGLPGDAGVLHQRLRQPGADAGAIGVGPLHGGRARRRSVAARGRLPGERLQGRLHPGFGRALFERDGTRWVGTEPPADVEPIKQFGIEGAME